MGLLILILLVIGLCSWFISRSVYKSQLRNNYKNPTLTAGIVFILTFAIIAAAIFFLIINNIRISR
jgi:magnesium-transporting ATPase (P-type)